MTSTSSFRGRRSFDKIRRTYVADFETTVLADDCRVWGWGLENVEDFAVEIDHTIDDFIERISGENSTTYFHNLKFDGHFIIDWLLNNGYRHVDDRKLLAGEFTSLISDMGKFYSINVRWKSGYQTEFRDSLKKFNMSVANVAKAFKLPESKGDIDYLKDRPVDYRMTADERDYIRRDVNIISRAVKQTLDSGMTRLTVGSDSLAEFKRVLGNRKFMRLFPQFPLTMDTEIRRAYRGGFTYPDPRFVGRKLGSGKVFDMNSLYPSIMYYRDMPYGEPEFVEGLVLPTAARPLTVFSVTFTAKLKPDHVPCIQIKGHSVFAPTEYLSEISEPTTLMVTNVDWELYNDHYDITVLEFLGGWRFHAISGVFNEYIDKWSKVKEESTGGAREIAKLHLNSLYGKFASNPNVASKFPLLKDGRVIYRRGVDEQRAPVYTAVGVFITSYGRDLTVRAAQEHYDVFAYADTDSLHLLTDDTPETLDIHNTRMGAWSHEYDFQAAWFIRAKAYLEQHPDGSYTNRIAGLPEGVSSKLTFDDVFDGHILHGKKTPQSVPGGIILVDTPYELKL